MYKTKPYKKKRNYEDNLCEQTQVYVPKQTLKMLREISEARLIPVSRLICYAIDNELDCAEPFTYKVELPDTDYKEYLYAKEAGLILAFLRKMPAGVSPDILLLSRRDLGIESKDDFMAGMRELYMKDLIEDFEHRGRYMAVSVKRVRAKGMPDKKRFKGIMDEDLRRIKRVNDEDIDRSGIDGDD